MEDYNKLASNMISKYLLECGMRQIFPASKVQRANMGPIWGRQHPGGPRVDPYYLGYS